MSTALNHDLHIGNGAWRTFRSITQLSSTMSQTNPDVANQWLKDMERIFDFKMCLEESRLAFVVYMLTREAEHWWVSMKSIMEEK